MKKELWLKTKVSLDVRIPIRYLPKEITSQITYMPNIGVTIVGDVGSLGIRQIIVLSLRDKLTWLSALEIYRSCTMKRNIFVIQMAKMMTMFSLPMWCIK